MTSSFSTDAQVNLPTSVAMRRCGCCAAPSRRLFTGLLAAGAAACAWPALAQQQQQPKAEEGVRGQVGNTSRFAKFVSAEDVEAGAAQQYVKMTREASGQRALAPADHPQVIRLRAIADRLIPFTPPWNSRARQWKWEINLIGSRELNAFCMPGGKIAFYYGILQKLQLDDDEVAQIMGHEMAHALREHARERIGKTTATQVGAGLLSSLLGLGGAGDALLNMGGQLLTLRFSREDESEADLVGLELAARAGYNPRAGVSLWRKMAKASEGAPPQWLSTHPAGSTRIQDIERTLPRVEPLYAKASKPSQRFAPPTA
jgi:predicted Zn-dependent protease